MALYATAIGLSDFGIKERDSYYTSLDFIKFPQRIRCDVRGSIDKCEVQMNSKVNGIYRKNHFIYKKKEDVKPINNSM